MAGLLLTVVIAAFVCASAFSFASSPQGHPAVAYSLPQGHHAVAKSRTPAAPLLLAKKKGGGGKKGGKKQKTSGMAWAQNFELKPTEAAALRELVDVAANTYRTRTGKGFHKDVTSAGDVPKAMWAVPKCLLILREEADGVICSYANPAAAEALGHPASDGYKSLIDKPFADLTAALGGDGSKKYESGYEKKLSASGDDGSSYKVQLLAAERWLLEKMAVVDGKLSTEPIGLAYSWDEWQLDDGTLCKPGGVRETPSIDPEEAAAMVAAQAQAVRRLKEEDGLTNDDVEVQEAVAELKRLKALVPE